MELNKDIESNNLTKRKEILAEELLSLYRFDITSIAAKTFSHNSFRYYTTIKTMKIIDNDGERFLYASNLNEMNDIAEADSHSDSNSIHALCFCNTDTEGIPMWYMYSGILGKGACLKINCRPMLDFLNSIHYVCPVGEDKKVIKDKKLFVGTDVDLKFGWVYYKDEKDDLFFHNRWYRLTDDRDRFFKDNCFVKDYPWHYENEFRIVVINHGQEKYKQIAIPVPDNVYKKCKVIIGPESNSDTTFSISKEKSKLKIRMNLYTRNEEELKELLAKTSS